MTIGTPTDPRWTRASLDYSANKYVVQNGLLFEYYDISCQPHEGSKRYIEIKTSPAVYADGIAMIQGNMYNVTLRDLARRRIDVTTIRQQQPANTNRADNNASGNTSTGSTSINPTDAASKTRDDGITMVRIEVKQGSSDPDWDQVSKDADLAWENQVGALLQTLHSKEGQEWEIANSAQPRSINEGSAVQAV